MPIRNDSSAYTRRRLLVVMAGAAVPVSVYVLTGGRATRPQSEPTTVAASPAVGSSAGVSVATSTASAAGTTSSVQISSAPIAAAFVPFDHDVGVGSTGAGVGRLQDRLRSLGFDPGPSDSAFGPATERAVWAFEKLLLTVAIADVTGVVTPQVWMRMNEAHDIRPLRDGPGTHLEVLLDRQVAVLYVDNAVRLITHISSGTGLEWCAVVVIDRDDGTQGEDGICGIAVTPGGVFHFERRFAGWRNSKLGRLYNPVYFNYGLAVHGASNVPKYPASHGCVRIPMHVAEYFPSLVADGDVVYVFDGVKQPEKYGAQVPTFDYPDPNYVDATTSTAGAPSSTATIPTRADATSTTKPTIHAEPASTTVSIPTTSSVHVNSTAVPTATTRLDAPIETSTVVSTAVTVGG